MMIDFYLLLLVYCIGLIIGYLIRMFVEDTDKEYEMMAHYQRIIKELMNDE